MENIRNIKQEIKEEIPDENEQNGNLSVIQNVKYEEPELEDDYGNYEYATATDVQEEEQELDSEPQPAIKAVCYSTRMVEFQYIENGSSDVHHQFHNEYENENEVFVNGEPEICVEDIGDSYLKENNASDPLAINTNAINSNDNLPKTTILNSTHTPLASSSKQRLVRRLSPASPSPPPSSAPPPPRGPSSAEYFEKRPVERSQQMQSLFVVRKAAAPPVKELVRKTYSLQHRLAHKTSASCNICHVCARSFDNPVEFERHRHCCTFKCTKCNLIFSNKTLLRTHLQNCRLQNNYVKFKHSKRDKSKVTVSHNPKFLGWDSCDICCMKFNSIHELREHRKQKHFFAKSYACHLCTKKFKNNFDAFDHLKRDH